MDRGVWPRGAAGDSGERKRRLPTAFAGSYTTKTQQGCICYGSARHGGRTCMASSEPGSTAIVDGSDPRLERPCKPVIVSSKRMRLLGGRQCAELQITARRAALWSATRIAGVAVLAAPGRAFCVRTARERYGRGRTAARGVVTSIRTRYWLICFVHLGRWRRAACGPGVLAKGHTDQFMHRQWWWTLVNVGGDLG
jgi:hypothetical protein